MKVTVDGEEAVLHITDQSVMFEKGGRVIGFERSAIRMVKPDGGAMIIAYSVGSEVKSVRVEPVTAVAALLISSETPSDSRARVAGLDEVFEKLYRDTREELEERLTKIQTEPSNKSLRLTAEEEGKYSQVSRQLENLLGSKYGFNSRAEDSPMSFWGLDAQPYNVQLDVVKALHVSFLRTITSPRAEKSDVVFSGTEVWPEDWSRILNHFSLNGRLYNSEDFAKYIQTLKESWKYSPGDRKPVLTR